MFVADGIRVFALFDWLVSFNEADEQGKERCRTLAFGHSALKRLP